MLALLILLSAEYMLEVIGAGATAKATQDYHSIWLASPESTRNLEEIAKVLTDSRAKGAVETTHNRKIATSWLYQVKENLNRLAKAYWRDPLYVMAKFVMCILGGIIMGFTFYKSNTSQQGSQNLLFVRLNPLRASFPLLNICI